AERALKKYPCLSLPWQLVTLLFNSPFVFRFFFPFMCRKDQHVHHTKMVWLPIMVCNVALCLCLRYNIPNTTIQKLCQSKW
ncbi:hypothetical protein QBC32DRAFT_343121, partial [Pseudoneurospora amorphoporcata]